MTDENTKMSFLSKLIETIARGVGILYEPTHIRRIAKAKADEIRIIGEAMEENIILPTSYDDRKIKISTEDFRGLVDRGSKRLFFQEITKQSNIDAVVENAAKDFDETTVVSNKQVDVAWSNMLFDSAGYISDPGLQELWGKILASEVVEPGQTSLRTLEIVRRLSSEEAILFDKAANYVLYMYDEDNDVMDYFIPCDKRVLDHTDINSINMIRLEDAGLVANSANVIESFMLEQGKKKEVFAGNDVAVVTLVNNDEKPMTFRKDIYLLSEAGREVYNVIHRSKVDTGECKYYKVVENYFYRDDIQDLWDGIDGDG